MQIVKTALIALAIAAYAYASNMDYNDEVNAHGTDTQFRDMVDDTAVVSSRADEPA